MAGHRAPRICFIAAALAIVVNTLIRQPLEALVGLLIVMLGVMRGAPVFAWWRWRERPAKVQAVNSDR